MSNVVRVGVGVFIRHPVHRNKVFAGIRKGSHGANKLALPGGHLELKETWEECAIREAKEETNLDIHNVEFAHVTNDIMPEENKHYITIFMKAECVDKEAEAENMEPHKCEGWDVYTWDDLCNIDKEGSLNGKPMELFIPMKNILREAPPSVIDFLNS